MVIMRAGPSSPTDPPCPQPVNRPLRSLAPAPTAGPRSRATPSPDAGRSPAGPEPAISAAERIEAWSGDPNFMTSLARGIAVIRAFTQQKRRLTISQLSQRTGIPRAAVRRCLYTLAQLGYVNADEGKDFTLEPAHPVARTCVPVVDAAVQRSPAAARPRQRRAARVVVDRAARRRRDPLRRAVVDQPADHVRGPGHRHPPARVLHVDGTRAARAICRRRSRTPTLHASS